MWHESAIKFDRKVIEGSSTTYFVWNFISYRIITSVNWLSKSKEKKSPNMLPLPLISNTQKLTNFVSPCKYNTTVIKKINFSMPGWVLGRAILPIHTFLIYLLLLSLGGKGVNYHFFNLFVCFTLYNVGTPCILNFTLLFLESLDHKLSENIYFYALKMYQIF